MYHFSKMLGCFAAVPSIAQTRAISTSTTCSNFFTLRSASLRLVLANSFCHRRNSQTLSKNSLLFISAVLYIIVDVNLEYFCKPQQVAYKLAHHRVA